MKKIIFLLITLILVSSCLDLNNDEFFFERPSLRLHLYDQTKAAIDDIDGLTAITFNSDYYDLHSHDLTLDENQEEILILHGVPEDNYNVFIFTEHHKAILDVVNYTITQEAVSVSHDPIKVGDGEYYVRRANSTQEIILKDLYVRFNVEINGALPLSGKNDFILTLENVPQEFDFYGEHSHTKLSSITPDLEYDRNNDIIRADFYSNKFCSKEDVNLILTVKQKEVFRFNLSSYLEEAAIDMALDNMRISITVDISTSGTGIVVNGWDHIESYSNEVGI